jgi:hypothetical protein
LFLIEDASFFALIPLDDVLVVAASASWIGLEHVISKLSRLHLIQLVLIGFQLLAQAMDLFIHQLLIALVFAPLLFQSCFIVLGHPLSFKSKLFGLVRKLSLQTINFLIVVLLQAFNDDQMFLFSDFQLPEA